MQREISNSTILTLGYVGTRGHHLIAQTSFNPGNAARCLQIRQILGPDNGCGPGGQDQIYDLGSGQVAYGTRPFSVTSGRYLSDGLLDFSNNSYSTTVANSNYNALEVSLEKKVGALRLLGAYTWSKSLDDASGFADNINPFNRKVSKALSAFDMAHNFVVSYSYDLPFQRVSASGSGPVHKFLDGWIITGITRFTTGLPISMGESGDNSLCGCGGVDRPNWNGQPIHFSDPRATDSHQYFSTNVFFSENPDGNTFGVPGTANRRFFHGPGLNIWDLSLHKTTHVTEKTSLEFRAEFFNIFNHAQFDNPTGNFASGNFGNVTSVRDFPRIGQLGLKFYF